MVGGAEGLADDRGSELEVAVGKLEVQQAGGRGNLSDGVIFTHES